jgi:tetratricopeptide (TPR) repeat protein
VQIDLRPVGIRVLWVAICFSAAALYVNGTVRQYRAFRLANSTAFSDILQATRLEPGNAEHWYRLANNSFFLNPEDAIASYKKAEAINPWNSRYSLDLARAYLATNKLQEQQAAVEHALQVDPMTPATLRAAADFYLLRGQQERAFDLLHRLIQYDPEHADEAIDICWRTTHDADFIITRALPRSTENYLHFLRFVIYQNDLDASRIAWRRLLGLQQQFPSAAGVRYVTFLIARNKGVEAKSAWEQLAAVNSTLRAYLPGANLVVNGGFELDLLNGGFDWCYERLPAVSLSTDTTAFHGGTRSLLIQFDGAVSDAGIREYVVLKPNTLYEFSAAYRTELEGAYGVTFEVRDTDRDATLAATEEMLGRTPWRVVKVSFKTGSETQLAVVRLTHGSGLIRGKLWVDDVSLVEK